MISVITTLNAILPSFVIMFCGWIVQRTGVVTHRFLNEASRLVFFVALPVMITVKFYEVDSSQVFPTRQIAVCVIATLIYCLVSWLIVRKIAPTKAAIGAMFQGATRSNFAAIGLYLINTLFGHAGLLNATLLMMATIPINNVTSVLVLSKYAPDKGNAKRGSIIKTIIMNPMVLSLAVVPLIWFKPPIPSFILHAAHDISALTLPLALIAVGASMQFSRIRDHIWAGGVTIILKLIVMPVIVVGFAVFAGIRGLDLASIALFAATPTATASYILAKQFHSDAEMTSWIIAACTLTSLATLPVLIIILRLLKLVP